ncbi:hypothetical protein Zmor_011864, partial [Zophobas morio]
IDAALDRRVPLSIDEYRALHQGPHGTSADEVTPQVTDAPFRFAGVHEQARQYEAR